jgi:hypothetical protein
MSISMVSHTATTVGCTYVWYQTVRISLLYRCGRLVVLQSTFYLASLLRALVVSSGATLVFIYCPRHWCVLGFVLPGVWLDWPLGCTLRLPCPRPQEVTVLRWCPLGGGSAVGWRVPTPVHPWRDALIGFVLELRPLAPGLGFQLLLPHADLFIPYLAQVLLVVIARPRSRLRVDQALGRRFVGCHGSPGSPARRCTMSYQGQRVILLKGALSREA